MAINNTEKTFSKMEFPLAIQRQDAFALDPTCVWDSLAKAENYAKTNPTAYVGQLLSVIVEGVSVPYQIKNTAGELEPIRVTVASDSEVSEMLDEVFAPAE